MLGFRVKKALSKVFMKLLLTNLGIGLKVFVVDKKCRLKNNMVHKFNLDLHAMQQSYIIVSS